MIRYDPTSTDQEKFLRTDSIEADNSKGEVTEDGNKKGFFSVTTDLKKAFTAGKTSANFSFGFNKDEVTPAETVTGMEEGEDDGEDEMVTKKTEDVATSFGLQLRGKGAPKSEHPFFFTANDPRLETGLDFFFEHKVDRDQL